MRLRIDGADLALPALPSRRSGSRGSRTTRNKREKAKRAAERRLARCYPTLYRVFLAEERMSRGLDPWPPGSPCPEGDLDLDLVDIETYEARDAYPSMVEAGIEVTDGFA